MKQSKTCQSCGMPMKYDPEKGGTEADGSKNLNYCGYCYQNGAFTQPDFTVDEMKAFVIEQLKKMKYPGFIAKFFARNIHKLERWRA